MSIDSHRSRRRLRTTTGSVEFFHLGAVPGTEDLPFAHKVMLENLLRHEDGDLVSAADIEALVAGRVGSHEIAFHPSRVFLHDTNGVPVLTDLAALRDAVAERGGDPAAVDGAIPAELTVDHSVSTDFFARPDAPALNVRREYERNRERYRFLKWGQQALSTLKVVPPGAGIMHQINVEYLARVVEVRDGLAFPDTVAGTDSHTTMVNGLSVLAWGVGGIEAEAALLGQPVSMLIPPVVGVELVGELRPGVTATDLVLTVTERMRGLGVVGAIVEFFGPGVAATSLATRCTLANMSPEFGSTAALFPVDRNTLDYLRLTGRPEEQVHLVEAYAKEQGLWHDPAGRPRFDRTVTVDLDGITPSLAGPRRPQDRLDLGDTRRALREALPEHPRDDTDTGGGGTGDGPRDGAVAIAAITSCTNTSNPAVMIAAGLLARNATRLGLRPRPWVKTSLAPGSRVVVDYLERAGLMGDLEALGFGLVGFGCMTCIGNSGALLPEVEAAVGERGLVAASVTSGNRNFDGRINNDVSLNFLASPPLVVAFALAGTVDIDLTAEPLGTGADGGPVMLADLWPGEAEVDAVARACIEPSLYTGVYGTLFDGDDNWRGLDAPEGPVFAWDRESTYLRRPPFLDRATGTTPPGQRDITGARVLQLLGDSVTTDHICPAGRIPAASAAGRFLTGQGVAERELNTYASRRGNWQVMLRGGFANPRLENRTTPGLPGGKAVDLGPDGADRITDDVHVIAERHLERGQDLIVIGGKEYGTGSSRDWAAKVTALLGVRAVIAESFERIHRSNLVGMGVLPLQFEDGQSAQSLGLTGREEYTVAGMEGRPEVPARLRVTARHLTTGDVVEFTVRARLDTSRERLYHRHGGLLPYILDRAFRASARG
ncbi:aconitate hydratase AcnA [Nocardiopsis changdeensis]|uniref:Aconitate hydratase n=1 Tax=Nocardiopsis changdeensis TaxID=2831969 RepID=A0ABX8BE59_9ACTN|nr:MULTISPECIES: aconitate hydratase AcnA [Nocardiopsis]QUX20539.1 aconitate hydratase AcnA [Nocardiopsis changdeensis]QYX36470.1 aconitate hydratase AcnA [Nocardiopsis sp. MT53]